ncbi:hypothetical protein [Mycobacterium shimoidei]|uniref:hypothetical protein n=1 Tax=Mycobacterium shimoidei TaxID=29313 RepID=UPI0012F50586|nr:hypothetical protein [Mycobacterium shimoidei]MCV7258085.1 hypothetical protein [Mycobacterium shimoidei]
MIWLRGPRSGQLDQVAVLLRTSPTAPTCDDEWHAAATVLEVHAEKGERDT